MKVIVHGKMLTPKKSGCLRMHFFLMMKVMVEHNSLCLCSIHTLISAYVVSHTYLVLKAEEPESKDLNVFETFFWIV